MTSFNEDDDLKGARFADVELQGARFTGCDLSGVVMRGVAFDRGLEVDSPWLFEGAGVLVNGVDVTPFVDAELNRRFPGRELRTAGDPESLRSAWSALQDTWAATLARAAALPAGTVDEQVDGEWSFAQTLRHLVFATDTWLGKAIQQREDPYHPLGQVDTGTAADGVRVGDAPVVPAYDEVLAARASRVAMVRDHLATVTAQTLVETRPNPHDPAYDETVLSCLHTILEEEWEHHRYAVRDLDALASAAAG